MADSKKDTETFSNEKTITPMADALQSILEIRNSLLKARIKIGTDLLVTVTDCASSMIDARIAAINSTLDSIPGKKIRKSVSDHAMEASSALHNAAYEIKTKT
jgi:hypothetical protein